MLVIDASVSLAWVIPDEASPETDSILELVVSLSGLVPAVWPLEVGNVLLGSEKHGRLDRSDVTRALALFRELPIRIDRIPADIEIGLGHVLTLARKHSLTAYDASYLELAIRKACPLATLDKKLIAAARAEQVELAIAI